MRSTNITQIGIGRGLSTSPNAYAKGHPLHIKAEENDIAGSYKTLLNELEEYNPELLDKERLLAVTKCDMIDKEIEAQIEPSLPKGVPHIFISSVSGEGLKELKDMLWSALQS